MALEPQVVPISFAQGVDTKSDPKQVVAGKLLTLENGLFQNTNEIIKRNGYTALSKSVYVGGTLASASGINTFKDELILIGKASGDGTFSYSPDGSKWTFPTGAAYPPIALSVTSVGQTAGSTSAILPDSAYDSSTGFMAFIWTDDSGVSGRIYASIVDTATKATISTSSFSVGATYAPEVLFLGTNFVFIYRNGANIVYRTVSTASPTVFSGETTIITDFNTALPRLDAAVIGSRLFVAYNASSTTDVKIFYLDTSLVKSSVVSYTGENANQCIAVYGDASNNVWVSYSKSNTTIRTFITDNSLAPLLAPTTVMALANVRNITGVVASTTSSILCEVSSTNDYDHFVDIGTITLAGAASGPAVIIRSLGLAGKSFTYGSENYFLGVYGSTQQPTYFLVKFGTSIDTSHIVAKISPSTAGGLTYRSEIPKINLISSGVYQVPFIQIDSLSTIGGSTPPTLQTRAQIMSATLDFTGSTFMLEDGNNLNIGGGFLWSYDGLTTAEQNFHLYPETITHTTDAGAVIPAGTYQYIAVYKWIDKQGQTNRSAPSLAVTVTLGGAVGAVELTTSTLRLTEKNTTSLTAGVDQIIVEFYRTTNGGTIFYRLDDPLLPFPLNSKSTDTVTFVDELPDATIIAQTELYTTGGEVDNGPVPAPLAMTTYKNRMIVIPAENPTNWWYSKEIIPGSPIEFSPFFVESVDQRGDGLKAASQMDDKLILFKKSLIYYVAGDGPSPSGANNNFAPAQIIATDSGTSNPSSVVLTPMGLMYQSSKGIYLLDRSLSVSYIGKDVEAYNSATVTSATLLPKVNQVRFTLNSGVCLMFDYLANQWSVFTNHSAVAATVFQDLFTYVGSDGQVYQEAPGVYTDNGAFVQLNLVTSWLSFAGLQGFQRVYDTLLLGEYASTHTLRVKVAYDFVSSYVQTDNITATNNNPYQYRVMMARQKCEAIQLQIQDINSGTPGQSMKLSAISLRVGAKKGLNKMATSSTYG